MKLANLLIRSGLTVAGTGFYLLFRRFFRKVKRTAKETIEKVEDKLEKNSTEEVPQKNADIPIWNV